MEKRLKEGVRGGRSEETEGGGKRREKRREKQLTLASLQMWHQCFSFPSHSASEAV